MQNGASHPAQLLAQAVGIGAPQLGNVAPAVAFGEGRGEESHEDIAYDAVEATQVAHAPIAPVMMVQIGGITYLIEAFPLLLLVAHGP